MKLGGTMKNIGLGLNAGNCLAIFCLLLGACTAGSVKKEGLLYEEDLLYKYGQIQEYGHWIPERGYVAKRSHRLALDAAKEHFIAKGTDPSKWRYNILYSIREDETEFVVYVTRVYYDDAKGTPFVLTCGMIPVYVDKAGNILHVGQFFMSPSHLIADDSFLLSAEDIDRLKVLSMIGDPESAAKLSKHYLFGKGDLEGGLYWAIIEAENGSDVGQLNVAGLMYYYYSEKKELKERAIFWLKKSMDNGNKDAKEFWDRIQESK